MIAAIYYEVITNREDNGLLRIRRFDIQTCTASDYSVRINLSDDWYEAYKREDERRLSEGRHKQCILRKLSREIEAKVSSLKQVLEPAEG